MAVKTSKDIAAKAFEAFPDVAADILNALLHKGEQIIAKESLVLAPTETLYRGEGEEHAQYEDLVSYEYINGKLQMIYLLANQSSIDYRMLLRKAGYVGGYYREQYDGKIQGICPVTEQILYWGKKRWNTSLSLKDMFHRRNVPEYVWGYVDDMQLHGWEMRYLPKTVRNQFTSDMRIVVDYLAEGDCYRTDQKIIHKRALIDLLRSLSGDEEFNDTKLFMEEMNIKEEDEIDMGGLFDQYVRKGREEAREEAREEEQKHLVETYQEFKVNKTDAVERLAAKLRLTQKEASDAVEKYWVDQECLMV